jgi:competence protein ComEC
VTGTDRGHPVFATLYAVKDAFQRALRTVLPEPAVALAEGILLGEKRALGEELTEAFRRSGIIHIVVLSGYNVMLVAGFFLFALSFVLSRRGRAIGGIIAIAAFALMVGLSPTVARASIMVGLVLIAFALGREYHVLRALLVAAAFMVALNPYLLVFDPGFQLSFLATLGLIAVAPHLETWPLTTGVWPKARALILATIATQLAVLPLLLYQIGEFSLVAVVVNLLVVPMVPIAMLATFLTGLFALVSFELGLIVAYSAFLTLTYILTVATVSASLPFAALSVPVFSFWYVLLGYVILGCVYVLGVYRARHHVYQIRVANEMQQSLADWTIEVSDDGAGGTKNGTGYKPAPSAKAPVPIR